MASQEPPRHKDSWPVGTRVEFVDAWGLQRYQGRVARVKTDDYHLCVDDDRGVRFYIHTRQIEQSTIVEKLMAMGLLPRKSTQTETSNGTI